MRAFCLSPLPPPRSRARRPAAGAVTTFLAHGTIRPWTAKPPTPPRPPPAPRAGAAPRVARAGRCGDEAEPQGRAYGFFVRSPHAFARIVKIDTEAARKERGVIAVLTGADMKAAGVREVAAHP